MFEQQFGVYPKEVWTSADGAVTGKDYRVVVCLNDTVFTALASATTSAAFCTKKLSLTMPAGTMLWDIQSLTISSGIVECHQKSR